MTQQNRIIRRAGRAFIDGRLIDGLKLLALVMEFDTIRDVPCA